MGHEFLLLVKALFFHLLFLCPLLSAGGEPMVTKMVFRITPADSSPTAALSSPKTMYVAGDRYARIEQETDLHLGDKNLIIVNQPDIWIIDSKKKEGGHMVNPGPDFTVHNPILGPDGPDELFGFQYGREVAFFDQGGTKVLGAQKVAGIDCEARELTVGDYRILLFVSRAKFPLRVTVFYVGKLALELNYISYEQGLPFDLTLFKPPPDIQITESAP